MSNNPYKQSPGDKATSTPAVPAEAPPPYQSEQIPTSSPSTSTSHHLQVPGGSDDDAESIISDGGIPASERRSMEDEMRELPTGWIREYDPT
jgi:hypothetical protein